MALLDVSDYNFLNPLSFTQFMEVIVKKKDNKLKFKCKKCGFCCDNTSIQLYPFDVFEICRELKIDSKEFHKRYTKFIIDKGMPRCILSNNPHCPFKIESLCSIHDKRPLRCRLFPVGRHFQEDKTEYILPKHQCIGFDTGHKQTIGEYLESQKIDKYDQESQRWNHFIISLKDNHILKNPFFPTIFRKIFYDFDDNLIRSYRSKLREENDHKEFMDNLYDISEILFKSISQNNQKF